MFHIENRVLLKSKLSKPSKPLVYFLVVLVLKSKPQFFQNSSILKSKPLGPTEPKEPNLTFSQLT